MEKCKGQDIQKKTQTFQRKTFYSTKWFYIIIVPVQTPSVFPRRFVPVVVILPVVVVPPIWLVRVGVVRFLAWLLFNVRIVKRFVFGTP